MDYLKSKVSFYFTAKNAVNFHGRYWKLINILNNILLGEIYEFFKVVTIEKINLFSSPISCYGNPIIFNKLTQYIDSNNYCIHFGAHLFCTFYLFSLIFAKGQRKALYCFHGKLWFLGTRGLYGSLDNKISLKSRNSKFLGFPS